MSLKKSVILCGALAMLALSALPAHSYAESKHLNMSLDECLEYAKDNSIVLKQAQLQVDSQEAEVVSSRGSFLPSISGGVSQSVSNYPTINSTPKSTYTGSYGLDLSLSLYKGGANRATLQRSGLGVDIANKEYEEFKNSLDVAITETFVEILYIIELIKVREKTIELHVKNEERGKVMLELGSINSADFAQLQSATASSRYDLVVAETQLSNLHVVLKNLLELTQGQTITIKDPNIPTEGLVEILPSVESVYTEALVFRPEILSSRLSVESAYLDTKIAESGFLPSLSLSAGTGISHSSSSDYTFSGQLRNNFSTSAGLSLSVPIFSGFKTRSSVRIARNTARIAELSLSDAEKNLYQTIETLHNNATTSQSQFVVSQYLVTSTKKSMELTQEQYEVGAKNIIELLTEQDNFTQAYQDLLTNKYQLILNRALLNFYKTNIIKL